MATSRHPSITPPPVEETDEQKRVRAAAEEKATRDQAEAQVAHLPKPGMPQHMLTGADVAEKGENMVRMLFPSPVTIPLAGYRTVHFPAGLNDVPESIASDPDHQRVFKANGATPTG